MYREQESNEHDSLRARFTTWLDLLLYREKLKYIRASQKRRNLIYLEELDEKTLFSLSGENQDEFRPKDDCAFSFENEKLAHAFEQLSPRQKHILEMLYAEEKTPDRIAAELNCSVAYVRNEKYRAMKKLRELLTDHCEEGNV